MMTTGRVLGLALAGAVLLGGCGRLSLADDDAAARGRRLFVQHGCNGCHTVGVVGTPIGPDLAGIGRRHSKTYLERWLRDPESQQPMAHMPRLALPADDIGPLAAYLASLR